MAITKEEQLTKGFTNSNEHRATIAMIGSTRFQDTFIEKCWELSKEGFVVTLPNFRPKTMMAKGFDIPEDILEDIGFKRIDAADIVYVVNEDGYIGSSTNKEIDYAIGNNKPIMFMKAHVVIRTPLKEDSILDNKESEL